MKGGADRPRSDSRGNSERIVEAASRLFGQSPTAATLADVGAEAWGPKTLKSIVPIGAIPPVSEIVQFSPSDQLRAVDETMTKNMQEMQGG